MSTRTLKYTEWLKLIARHGLGREFENLSGYPVPETAQRLGVSRQRVYQLIESDVLDTLVIKTIAGTTALTLVTEASLERYLAGRTPDRGRQGYFAFPGVAAT